MVYVVVNEGEVVMATRDKDKALSFALDSSEESVKDYIEDCGRDIDDLTPEELGMYTVGAGADGGCFTVESIRDKDLETLEEIETEHSGVLDTSDILEMLEFDEDDDSDFEDIEDDDVDYDEFGNNNRYDDGDEEDYF